MSFIPPVAKSLFGNRFPRLVDAAPRPHYPPAMHIAGDIKPARPATQPVPGRRERDNWRAAGEPRRRRPTRSEVEPLPAIAYIASTLPMRSETFVYREIRALRERGRSVQCISLYPPTVPGAECLQDIREGLIAVYGGYPRLIKDAGAEFFGRPIRSVKTMLRSIGDALAPGETMAMKSRLKLPLQAMAGLALARRLRPQRIGKLHAHFAHAPTTVAMYTAGQLGIPFSFTAHANDIFANRALLKRKLQRASAVACISQWHREFYLSVHPAAERYHLVRCGVDTRVFKPNWRSAELKVLSTENETRSIQNPLRIVCIARMVEKKGIDTLLHAVNRLMIPWTLTIAGDGIRRKHFQQLAEQLRLGDRVNWLGSIDNHLAPALLTEQDVLALPCRTDSVGDRDGIPVVLIEAMATGLPVIAGDLPAIRELITDNESGLLIAGDDVDALVERLNRVAADPDLRSRLGAQGRRRVEQEFSFDANFARLERCLSS